MARKLIVRIGTESTVPILEIGEPGYDTDTKVSRIGDGTVNPPRIVTTKSNDTSFEYPDVDYFKYKEIRLYDGGKVDGVTPSKFNQKNGLVVRQADNDFDQKTLEGANYTDPLTNVVTPVIQIENGDGTAEGNIKIKLSATILAKIIANTGIQSGDTTGRDPNPNAGLFRYNSDTGLFEGFVDSPLKTSETREWRSMPNVFAGVVNYMYGVHFTSVDAFKLWTRTRITSNSITLTFPSGRNQFDGASWNFDDCLSRNIIIKGVDPIDIPVSASPVFSVTGSSNNYSVTYNLQGPPPSSLQVGSFVAVDCPVVSGLTGTHSGYVFGASEAAAMNGRTTFSSFTDAGIANIDINKAWVLNLAAYSQLPQVYARKVQAVSGTGLTLTSAFTHVAAAATFYVAEEVSSGVASLTAGSNTVNISGVTINNFIDPEDIVAFVVGSGPVQMYRVAGVAAGSITIYGNATATLANATILYIKTSVLMHCGAWRVTNIDAANNRITLANKCYNQSPSTRGVRNLRLSFVPTVIERTNNVDHLTGFSAGVRITLKDAIFVASTDYTYRCLNFRNSKLQFAGIVGFTKWKKPGYFENTDILGDGTESIICSDTINVEVFTTGSDASNAFTSCFEFYNTRVVLNGIIVSGCSRSPVYARSESNLWLRRFIGVGNDGIAYRSRSGSGSLQDCFFCFNGPTDFDVNIAKLSKANFRTCAVYNKGALNGGLSAFGIGNSSTVFSEYCLISCINASLTNNISLCNVDFNANLHIIFNPGGFFMTSNNSQTAVNASMNYFQGGMIWNLHFLSKFNWAYNLMDGIYPKLGDMSGCSDFQSNTSTIPAGTNASTNQFTMQTSSRAVSLGNSIAISFNAANNSTFYSA